MRKAILGLATVLAALAATGSASAATATVNIYGSGFSPGSVTITAGDTVVWKNLDSAKHQVLASSGAFVSPVLSHDQTYTFTFQAAGTYHYSDELHPKLTGTITVKAPPPTLTLAASAPSVGYGKHLTVSGIVSNHAAGEQVTIWYQPYGQASPIEKATVLSVAGGAFSLDVVPTIQTVYQAEWRGVFSPAAAVGVAPAIVLGRDNGWIVHVGGGRTFAGRAVQFQRLNPATGQWVTLRRALLNSRSSVRFAARLPKGMNHVRVALSVNQAGAGFLGSFSQVLAWRVR